MHIAYLRGGGALRSCPLCVERQADPKSPYYRDADKRVDPPLPCPEHGDPSQCEPENRDAIDIYRRLNNGNHIYIQHDQGKTRVWKAYIDVNTAVLLCQAYGVTDIPETLDKLEIIHGENTR